MAEICPIYIVDPAYLSTMEIYMFPKERILVGVGHLNVDTKLFRLGKSRSTSTLEYEHCTQMPQSCTTGLHELFTMLGKQFNSKIVIGFNAQDTGLKHDVV